MFEFNKGKVKFNQYKISDGKYIRHQNYSDSTGKVWGNLTEVKELLL